MGDTSSWALKLGEEILKKRPQRSMAEDSAPGNPFSTEPEAFKTNKKTKTDNDADVLCLARPERESKKSGGSNETHSGTILEDELTDSSASSFLAACAKHERLVKWGV